MSMGTIKQEIFLFFSRNFFHPPCPASLFFLRQGFEEFSYEGLKGEILFDGKCGGG
jgi:hypothetical protein